MDEKYDIEYRTVVLTDEHAGKSHGNCFYDEVTILFGLMG